MSGQYDIAIIGAGTAGMTAGLFTARYGLRTVILEQMGSGGQVLNAERIENFPGLTSGISGFEYGQLLQEQAEAVGATFELADVTGLRLEEPLRVLSTYDGEYQTKVVIVAAGSTLRRLGISGEEAFHGRGVSYCATCDGAFFADQVVAVVGGGDSALDEVETLTKFASEVILFHRRDSLRAQQALQDRVLSHNKVRVLWNTVVEEVLGNREVSGVRTLDTVTGETSQVDLSGLFIYVGLEPNTRFLQGLLSLDDAGHIPTDPWMATEVPGVYAAGDIRQHSAAQLVTAAGDGATAAIGAFRYIQGRSWPS